MKTNTILESHASKFSGDHWLFGRQIKRYFVILISKWPIYLGHQCLPSSERDWNFSVWGLLLILWWHYFVSLIFTVSIQAVTSLMKICDYQYNVFPETNGKQAFVCQIDKLLLQTAQEQPPSGVCLTRVNMWATHNHHKNNKFTILKETYCKLPDHCIVFQAELSAFRDACDNLTTEDWGQQTHHNLERQLVGHPNPDNQYHQMHSSQRLLHSHQLYGKQQYGWNTVNSCT
jgi:hypothetical protein